MCVTPITTPSEAVRRALLPFHPTGQDEPWALFHGRAFEIKNGR